MVKPTPMVAANWKCNGTKASVDELLQGNALWAVAVQNCIAADTFTGKVSGSVRGESSGKTRLEF
eukprot:gene2329-3609_t